MSPRWQIDLESVNEADLLEQAGEFRVHCERLEPAGPGRNALYRFTGDEENLTEFVWDVYLEDSEFFYEHAQPLDGEAQPVRVTATLTFELPQGWEAGVDSLRHATRSQLLGAARSLGGDVIEPVKVAVKVVQ